jgi:hypothetical protein
MIPTVGLHSSVLGTTASKDKVNMSLLELIK